MVFIGPPCITAVYKKRNFKAYCLMFLCQDTLMRLMRWGPASHILRWQTDNDVLQFSAHLVELLITVFHLQPWAQLDCAQLIFFLQNFSINCFISGQDKNFRNFRNFRTSRWPANACLLVAYTVWYPFLPYKGVKIIKYHSQFHSENVLIMVLTFLRPSHPAQWISAWHHLGTTLRHNKSKCHTVSYTFTCLNRNI